MVFDVAGVLCWRRARPNGIFSGWLPLRELGREFDDVLRL